MILQKCILKLKYLSLQSRTIGLVWEKSVPVWYQSKIIREAQHYCQDNQQQIRLILAELQNLMTNQFPIDSDISPIFPSPSTWLRLDLILWDLDCQYVGANCFSKDYITLPLLSQQ